MAPELVALSLTLLFPSSALAQAHPPTPNSSAKQAWAFALTADGYVTPNEDGYVSPILVANQACLHLEARYNYENLKTGSLWVGYNFSVGKRLVLNDAYDWGRVWQKYRHCARFRGFSHLQQIPAQFFE